MGDSNYQQVLRKYAARVDDYQNIYSTGTLSQCNSPSQKAKAYYNWLPSATLTRANAEETIQQAEPYWLFPKLTRNQVTSLLFDKPHGSFLVRESSTSNCYALSVRLPTDEPPVKHYLIERIPNGYAIQGSGLPFPTIPKLLAYFCFSTSGGMPCFLRPPILPDGDSFADYTPMSDVSGQEQNNLQGTPVMGWTSPSSAMDSTANVVKTDRANSFSQKPLEIIVPPKLPPKADSRLKDGRTPRKAPRSILLWQSFEEKSDTVTAIPYAVIPVGQVPTELNTKSLTDSSSLTRKRAPHIYDEIDIPQANSTEAEVTRKEDSSPVSKSDSEESPYAEPNNYDDDFEVNIPTCEIVPPPLPPRAPSMTPPCSPKLANKCSPEPISNDEYVEPEVIEKIKSSRSLSAPSSQLICVFDELRSKNYSITHPLSPPKSPPKSPKVPKEKKPKKSGTLYNLLRTFKKKSQTETANITRIFPEHIPSEEVSFYQNSINRYNLDFPNVAEDAGSELQRRLSGKCRAGSRQGTLTRHRSLSPLDAYVDMHSPGRPISGEYYEPMKLRQPFLSGDYDIPYSSPSPSPAPEERETANTVIAPSNDNTDNMSLRKSKSESSLSVDESRPGSLIALLTPLSQSTECMLNDKVPENQNSVTTVESVDQMDSSAAVEVKQPVVPPRPQKPPIGPKPQIKPKPLLPPKPSNRIMRPPISPRTKIPSQYSVPKLPPKPPLNKSKSATQNGTVTRTKADIRIPEDVGGNDRKVLKPIGKPPPPPPPKVQSRASSFVMVRKPPAAKGMYAIPSTIGAGSKEKYSPTKSPTTTSPDASEDKKKEAAGVVVELKESDDDELEQVEDTVDNTNATEQALTTSTEAVDGTVGVQESSGKKRKKNKKAKKNWSPFTFLHKKPAEQRIKEFILQLSLNKNTSFGSSLAQFMSTTKREVANLTYQQLLSNVRSYIDSAREKLQKDYSKDLVEHGMKGCRNFDVLLEKILQDIIVQPLQQIIQFKIEKHFSETLSLQQLQRNITAAKALMAADLGIRDHLIPPGPQAIEEARKLFEEMQRVHSGFSKIELLLQAVRITYDNVQDIASKNKSTRRLGADDFLPLFIYVLVHADFCKAEVEAEYMWGLVHPSLLNGEGGYYLTTLTSAVNVLKETQFGPEDNQEVKDLPSMDDSQAFLCVSIEEIDGCACEPPMSKTLPVHVSMTVEQTCVLISDTLEITNPGDYGLYAITSSSEKLLEKHQCPQKIKHDLSANHQSCNFVYKTI